MELRSTLKYGRLELHGTIWGKWVLIETMVSEDELKNVYVFYYKFEYTKYIYLKL